MKSERSLGVVPLLAIVLSWFLMMGYGEAADTLQQPVKLIWHYYKLHTTCPYAEVFIRHEVGLFWKKDRTITAKLLRLLSADCLSRNGCDASILLDGPTSEKTAPQNVGLGGFEVIDKIKVVLEDRCPGVVSCADLLNLATRDAVHLAGGPSYPVFTGRRDGLTSSASDVDFPSPSISWQQALQYFQSKGLDVLDMTTLLGAHSLGTTQCSFIMDRLYNFNGTGKPDPSMDPNFLADLRKKCGPVPSPNRNDMTVVYLDQDSGAEYRLSGSYYNRILENKAVLEIDQQLLFGNDTSEITQEFAAGATGFEEFRRALAFSMNRMGEIEVLTGDQGEIRRNCRHRNGDNPHLK